MRTVLMAVTDDAEVTRTKGVALTTKNASIHVTDYYSGRGGGVQKVTYWMRIQ